MVYLPVRTVVGVVISSPISSPSAFDFVASEFVGIVCSHPEYFPFVAPSASVVCEICLCLDSEQEAYSSCRFASVWDYGRGGPLSSMTFPMSSGRFSIMFPGAHFLYQLSRHLPKPIDCKNMGQYCSWTSKRGSCLLPLSSLLVLSKLYYQLHLNLHSSSSIDLPFPFHCCLLICFLRYSGSSPCSSVRGSLPLLSARCSYWHSCVMLHSSYSVQ